MKRVLVFSILLGIIICLPCIARAQSVISNDLSIDTIPLDPKPGSTVTVQASSYSMDLSQSTLKWTYNNTTIAQGVGKTSVAVVAPANGVAGVITVTATGGGQTVSASTVLRPGSVDLLWEAVDAYTPPFYKGKALLPVNGLIRYTAIPASTAPKGLTYTWSRNNSALPDDSGYNKSSLLFKQNEFNPEESVNVTISGATYAGSATSHLSPIKNPQLLAYKSSEGYVNYANGYNDTIPFTQSGMVLRFEPYFFSIPHSIMSDLDFDMKIDNQPVDRSMPNEVGLSRPQKSGQSIVDLTVTPKVYGLQHAQKLFTLRFN